jgi:ribosomal protein S18 acetylase RimI-like enzyme
MNILPFNRAAGRRPDRVLETGVLRNGAAFEVRRLNQKNLDEIYNLHLAIHAALKPEESTFISVKSRQDFESYLKGKGVILGVISEGKLIAMACLLLPDRAHPETGTADMPLAMKPETVGVLQSDSVLPAYRGNKLQQALTRGRITIAREHGRRHILALADTHNLATIKSLLNCGLAITGMGVDPDDGGQIFHMHGRLQKDHRGLARIFKRKL